MLSIKLYSSQQFVFVVTLVFNRTAVSIGSYSQNVPSNTQSVLLVSLLRHSLSSLNKSEFQRAASFYLAHLTCFYGGGGI